VSVGVRVAQVLFLFSRFLDERVLSGIWGYPEQQGLAEPERQRPDRRWSEGQQSELRMASGRAELRARPQEGLQQRELVAAA
jgi:hypothetical protein